MYEQLSTTPFPYMQQQTASSVCVCRGGHGDLCVPECPNIANATNVVRGPKNGLLLYLHVKIVAENEFFSLFH